MQNVTPFTEFPAQPHRATVACAGDTGFGMMMTIITTITRQRGACG